MRLTENTEWTDGIHDHAISDSAHTDTSGSRRKKNTHCAYSNNLAHSRQTTSSNCARHTASRLAFLFCPAPDPAPDPILDPVPDPTPDPLNLAAALAARRAAVCGPLPSSASARRPTSAQSDMLLVPDEEDAEAVPGRRPCPCPCAGPRPRRV